jgi:hypothetical protein
MLSAVSTGVTTSGGTKGLLEWIQGAMPNFYAVLSPALINHQRSLNMANGFGRLGCGQNARLKAMYSGNFSGRAGMGNLAGSYVSYYSGSPVIDSAALDSSVSQDLNDLTIQPATPTSASAAQVANTSPTSNSTATAISAIAGAVASGTIAASEISANNTLLQTNLLRAQEGLPPLSATTSSSGLVSLSSGSGTMLLVGGAILAAVLLGSKKSA